MKIEGNIIDIHKREIYAAFVEIIDGRIQNIERNDNAYKNYIMPGFIDAHVHIESSMLTPAAFAETAVKHGTVSVVSDPHEIANVMGIEGVDYMIESASKVPMKFYFGAPSCVPATAFESNGARLDYFCIKELLERKDIYFLSEMMNYPGVISNDNEIGLKLKEARRMNKPVDGHAPGLRGMDLKKYADAGISTDHECSSLEEAQEKLANGMKIQIREGSAARNLEALHPLFDICPDKVMICCDDIHPEMLEKRHINTIVKDLLERGYDIFDVIRSVSIIPREHYNIDTGLLRRGDRADFIIIDSIDEFNVLETWINGNKVFDRGDVLFDIPVIKAINKFNCSPLSESEIALRNQGGNIRLIEAVDGDLFTRSSVVNPGDKEWISTDTSKDILKIIVKDRYNDTPPSIGFIRGFGIKSGAFASSVAHDSHNIIALGVDDKSICKAVNRIVEAKGGLSVVDSDKVFSFPLEIAGLMSNVPCGTIARDYEKLSGIVKDMGCQLNSPFMTLSFMALLVIPELKISDKGLFDVQKFELVDIVV